MVLGEKANWMGERANLTHIIWRILTQNVNCIAVRKRGIVGSVFNSL